MKTRILTALIAGALFLTITSYRIGFIIIINLICLIAFKELINIIKASNTSKQIGVLILCSNVLFLLYTNYLVLTDSVTSKYLLYTTLILSICHLLGGITGLRMTRFKTNLHYFISLFYYPGWSLSLLLLLITQNGGHRYTLFLGILFLIWASDSFAYFIGKFLGKTPLYKAISPKKTIEGFVGGLIGVLILAIINHQFLDTQLSQMQWLVIGVIVWFFGTWGDLYESVFKRSVEIKDSGNILPGHGGILDRFDSLIFAFPFISFFLIYFS